MLAYFRSLIVCCSDEGVGAWCTGVLGWRWLFVLCLGWWGGGERLLEVETGC